MGIVTRALIAAVLGIGLAGPVVAQSSRLEITPFAGGFIPTALLGQIRHPGIGSTPLSVQGEVTTGGAVGGRLTWSGPGRLGIEATGFYAASDVRIALGPIASVFDANVQGGSLKGVYRATNEGSGTDLLLAAGVSGISHKGRAFELTQGQFDIGGVAGAGLHIVMSSQITLRFDGELYVYSWSAGVPGFSSKLQTDVLMTAGLGLKLGR